MLTFVYTINFIYVFNLFLINVFIVLNNSESPAIHKNKQIPIEAATVPCKLTCVATLYIFTIRTAIQYIF